MPFRLRWEYGTVPVAFSTTDTVPYPQTLRKIYGTREIRLPLTSLILTLPI